jgi:hypothetical protein
MNVRAIRMALFFAQPRPSAMTADNLLATDMDLWIQPCTQCADLYGKAASEPPHQDLALNSAGAVKDARVDAHYTCVRCRAAFARIVDGPPTRQIWMLLNAGQH